MTRTGVIRIVCGIGVALLGLAAVVAADDLAPVRAELERSLPQQALERLLPSPPLVFRGAPPRGPAIYRERVNGVVLVASTTSVGTGVLISEQGDIITNEHIVRRAHEARGSEWIAVWFKPPPGVPLGKRDFLVARVHRKNPRHDLAHVRLAQPTPPKAAVIPLASLVPAVGQEVFTIGHPKSYLWSFAQGIVSQIRPNYEWRYEDGVLRSATAIQTQAPIDSGSSGGPLLDEQGAMVGIVIGSATETAGVHFAVAVQHVRELLPR
ncbi:MAG: S1 family peptidase [Candidatus Rokuibacteriota bacterium]